MPERGLSNMCDLRGWVLGLIVLTGGCARQLLPAEMEAEPEVDAGANGATGGNGGGAQGDSNGSGSGGDGQGGTGDMLPPAGEELTDGGLTSGSTGGSGGGGSGGTGFMIPDFGFGDDAAVPELSDAAPKAEGDLVISELLPYPEGSTPHEWIELYNPTASTFDLVGCKLASETGEHFIRSTLLIGPASYLVLGHDEAAADGIAVLYTYDDANFSNSSDTISISCGDVEVDTLSYETELTQQGQSIQLSASMLSASGNDTASGLCLGTSVIGISQNQGTPGAVNALCTP